MAGIDEIGVYAKRRVLLAALGVMFLFFFVRLYQLQLLYSDVYGKQSEENSIRAIPRVPVRGLIFDRNGTLLVDNRPSFTVTVMPFEFRRGTTGRLASILGFPEDLVEQRLRQGEAYSRFAPVRIKRDIDFPTLSALEEQKYALEGVDFQSESQRFYPAAARGSHLFGYLKEISEAQLKAMGEGYVQGDIVGATGLESRYEPALRGTKGAELSLVNVRGQVIGPFEGGRHDTPPVEGRNLHLAVDAGVQALAESLMADKRGAVVALDPRTGGIIALVSKPDFDLAPLSGVTPAPLWRALNNDEGRPLFNRATLTRYPPGSTYKMIVAIAALEQGIVEPGWRVQCGGSFRFGNKVFKDEHTHGSVDMIQAIQKSCNVYFYQLMLKVGLDPWAHYGAEFGFGRLTGIDITEESAGLLPTTEWMNRRYGKNGWTRGFLVSLGIGQGELGVTPVQMAGYAAQLGMRGIRHQPHAVVAMAARGGVYPDSVRVQSHQVGLKKRTWDVVLEGMRRVVQEPGGTASLARVKGVQAAGKTGTAQNPHGKSHAWFIGFAPFENPQIAIAVLVENVGYGGSYAAPIAGLCFEQYLFGRLVRFDTSPSAPVVRDETEQTDPGTIAQSGQGGRAR